LIRRTTLWALRALLYLAGQPAGHLAFASEIAGAVGAPTGTTGKVLHRLSLAGMVVSQRGYGGGFLLAEPPASIGLLRVLQVMDDPVALALDAAQPQAFARLDDLLAGLHTGVLERLETMTIADLAVPAGDGGAT
jgi:Rrf2 family protein